MGLAQGAALAAAIRAEVARRGLSTRRTHLPSLRPLVSGRLRGRGAGRELFRHFAHQAERLEGLAQAAQLPLDSLLALQLEEEDRPGPVAGWFVRESRPVVGFPSLEIALPDRVPALAGVNAAGLAVVAHARASGDARLCPGRDARHAPPLLLVQDCLARFEDLSGALDWCRKRPVEGNLVLALGDASGETARIVFAGPDRSIERGGAGLGVALECRLEAGCDAIGPSAGAPGGGATRARFDPVRRGLQLEPEAATRPNGHDAQPAKWRSLEPA